MIGIIYCMHWEWKNCPFGWQSQYNRHVEGQNVILEAVISQDLWIWHSFFGMASSNNDINVLHRSPIFNRLMQCKAPRVSYEVNGNAYDKPYYLADGIYPDWATLVKSVCNPNSEKTGRFAKRQEACRKDVERGFGVLQARWAIVLHPARTWSLKTMHEVMTCDTSPTVLFCTKLPRPKREGSGATKRRHNRRRGLGLGRGPCMWAPRAALDLLFRLLKASVAKPPVESHDTKTFQRRRAVPSRGFGELAAPAGEGIHLPEDSRHDRLSDE
ncbi:hypothetical protein QYE76_048237 [Lolium multiflorum]|uniref:Protein ALP1-like n=1 Tax=Lolium multiflorum TaxID=4521 RepID=A0AAD8QF13_LOLMU|nr:hypothetical protein QYE76_048237 [Lolium multiflorum]